MRLEQATKNKKQKKQQNVFKSNLDEISSGRFKSEEKKLILKILNCFTNQEEKLLLIYQINFFLQIAACEQDVFKANSY